MEPDLDALEAIVTRFIAGSLAVDGAAKQIVAIGFSENFTIGAESLEALESPDFQPFRTLLDAVLRLQNLQRPA